MAGFPEPILHVDMDAFYVEVERLRRPELEGVPVVVGGLGNRGVVASASYEARAYGVRSAMPIAQARRLCPQARYVPPDHPRYQEVSTEVFALLATIALQVEGLSIDEAFLDVSGLRLHYADGAAIGEHIRRRLRAELRLPASVGVAANKFLAKLASDRAKPDGLLVVAAGDELSFLHPLPVTALWGVGAATRARLEELGVATVGDLAGLPEEFVVRRLGEAMGRHLWELAWGRDPRPVEPGDGAKSISVEVTYDRDLTGEQRLDRELVRHAERLGRRLRRAGFAARTVGLKVRFEDFTTFTRSVTLDGPVDGTRELVAAARELLAKVDRTGRGVRLLGLGGSGLVPSDSPRQLHLDQPDDAPLTEAADRVRERFGEQALRVARLVEPPESSPPTQGNERPVSER